ncbi:right-handed parallel beta-helix repeat-containing protein [Calycomorphotria hydatis]|uniref:Right handed beta helix domain-containing protein n=1 Tax=Calycomorphotria hydatis TaxID=2528027 RepID=A0A517TCY1_9PLAN|nr:right-handed parallel beta-helix repeat-containing protein [Calycomorphotria hydatis]QDT66226.1 hypothetical protein V22_34910 [Calycomorphotria hydatis]
MRSMILLAVCSFFLSPGGAFAGWEIYVSAERVEHADGSQAAPYGSLAEARDAIRAARKTGKLSAGESVSVLVQPGIYQLDSTLKFGSEDSGTPEGPVVFRSVEQGQARVQGGIRLQPADFTKLTDAAVLSRLDESIREHVLVIDLSERYPGEFRPFHKSYRSAPVGPWLYVSEQPMTLARWPNDDWATFTKVVDSGKPNPNTDDPALQKSHPGSFEFSDSRPARWNLDEGVWLNGYWTHDWFPEVIQVQSYDPEQKVIGLAAPHTYGLASGTWGGHARRFFALNSLDELDTPGEWYLDRPNKRLYFYPEQGWPEADVVLGTLTAPLVQVEGAKHIKFEGLRFGYGHADAMRIRNSDHVEVKGCTIANLAGGGVVISGGAECKVRSCDLFNLGTIGVVMSSGDRKSLTPANHLAENNHIHHYGQFQRTYAPGIGVHGCGQVVRNNSIHDAPHNAIGYSGNEHLFEKNEVYRVVMETGDSGAFYTGRDWTSQGNILRHNYIHDLGGGTTSTNTIGIYLDDCDSGDTVEGNIFYRSGRAMLIGGGRDNLVLNNLMVDCPIGIHLDSRGMTWKQWNNPEYSGWNLEGRAEKLNYKSPPWSERYPNLANIMNDSPREPLHNVFRDNVLIDCSNAACQFDNNVKKVLSKLDVADNLVVRTNDSAKGVKDLKGFENLEQGQEKIDAVINAQSPPNFERLTHGTLQTVLPTFEPIPVSEIGLYQDEYRKELPQ